ncbi:regulatory protein ToxS [Photobacterium toruni]|uniref:Regulatory protein ToxS n=1 Tax=Photobacterium toruni TaxID=1935446 RepID=A0A1T4KGT8_9GAMM|nr:regulatory protein ToxS [Photobacterium toruni]MEC6832429.1 regulatory protein ToxS [Photobacterium toruni]SJZ41586.1 Transmembrane regulatory protein ToxS [Photobacterium toruni]
MSLTASNQITRLLHRYWPFLILISSIVLCSWVYFSTDYKQQQLLMSREWQSTTISQIESLPQNSLQELRQVKQNSNMVFLPNHTYSRITILELHSDKPQPLMVHISESGRWDVSGGYLLTEPLEFKDITSGSNHDFDSEQLKMIRDIFRMNAQESRRIDIINEHTLLLTSLTHGSKVLFSTK